MGIGGGAEQPFPGDVSSELFKPYDLSIPAGVTSFDSLSLRFESVAPGNEAWIGLVEGLPANASTRPLWVSRGRYRVDGLAVEQREDAPYPEVSFPKAKGFVPRSLETGVHVVYLEAWERHLTHVEDPGLLEPALGGTVDSCTRVEAVGQVKRVKLPADLESLTDPALFRDAFDAPDDAPRTLHVLLAPVPLDPTGLGAPLSSGYTGGQNRLYRFEVHAAGELGKASVKWSRNNGASLFRILRVMDNGGTLALPATCDVRNGDLLEVLTETVELGDQDDAKVYRQTDVRFSPPNRAVGQLFFVREKSLTGTERLIELRDLTTRLPARLEDAVTKQPGMKIRLWDGFFVTQAGSSFTWEIEDGLKVKLGGGLSARVTTGSTRHAGARWRRPSPGCPRLMARSASSCRWRC